MNGPLSPTEIYSDRKVFLLGGTGFLGKVTLAMLLHNFPSIGRVYVMVRAGSGTSSEERFWAEVVGSPAFDPLRERYGAALEGLLEDKVRVVGGDITLEHLGYSEQLAQAIADDIDVIINSSGKVSFNPALDQSMRTNVGGTRNILAFARRMKRPALVHVSTCFVAGNRSGQVWEDEPVEGYFPRRDELEGVRFSVEKEIADCEKQVRWIREQAQDAAIDAEFLSRARARLRAESRDPDNERYLRLARARERKNWVREQLSELGQDRARRWGWPNIYTYTKALAEQLVAEQRDIVRTIVRPSVVESAVAFPFAGWNEGFTTTAPLIFLALKGQNLFLASDELILDITPVDYIAGGLLAAAAQASVEQPPLVYQLCSGDENPIRMERVVTLLGLAKRRHLQQKGRDADDTGQRLVNELLARMEARPADQQLFDRSSAPMFNRLARRASRALERVRPRWGAGQLTDAIDRVKARVDRLEDVTRTMDDSFSIYRPFTVENHYEFRADNIRALVGRFVEEERHLLPWTIGELDWYHWWLEIHMPGLKKWVLPELEKDFAARPRAVFTYNHLLELFETAARLHPTRTAMRMERDGREDVYSYRDIHELAGRAAVFLHQRGVEPGGRVMLLSENRPEWAMAYFGVIKAGATCVPVDRELSTGEIANLVRSGDVRGILASDVQLETHADLIARLRESEIDVDVWTLDEVFIPIEEEQEQRALAALPKRVASDSVASLIFTSGTTGQPKGVMLSHRNFTSMVAQLDSVFEVSPNDGLLSVLPLHHTFEFSAGLLMPLSRGAQITYLGELTGDAINRALGQQHTTAIIGVPALWELLERRIRSRLADRSPLVARGLDALVEANRWLRERVGLNVGRFLFWPLHQRFGGRIRYLISGGSALADDVKRFFFGLGMTLLEGYGLTEAAPVLTVARPGQAALFDSVGQPLPNVELAIADPDEHGIGEVIARGPTVMAGYYENPTATEQTLVDNWLHTGDLGYLDEQRNLYLVGRRKDVIVDSNGKNVYPDELEPIYADHELIKELSIVGLPDGAAERVAALVVVDYERDESLTREQAQSRVRDHVRAVSATLPFYKRIKVVHLWDRDLPRTVTRKVKRREVVAELERLQRLTDKVSRARDTGQSDEINWLFDVVANVSGRPRAQVRPDTRLSDLGFDSLMYTELAVAIEAAGGTVVDGQELTGIGDLRELASVVRRGGRPPTPVAALEAGAPGGTSGDDIRVPEPLARLGIRLLGAGQRALYRRLLESQVEGRANIPYHENFIAAPNHCSHLDIGLAKIALGDAGRELAALAATDYFFDTRLKRAYFENFTNLVPMDRSGSLRKSLRQATDLLRRGHNMLIFAEGTRSISGEMGAFRASLGHLALSARVGILPMHIWGTYDALPKGALLPRGREIGVRIGPFLDYDTLCELTAGLPRAEASRLASLAAQRAVEHARDGKLRDFSLAAVRAEWDREHGRSA